MGIAFLWYQTGPYFSQSKYIQPEFQIVPKQWTLTLIHTAYIIPAFLHLKPQVCVSFYTWLYAIVIELFDSCLNLANDIISLFNVCWWRRIQVRSQDFSPFAKVWEFILLTHSLDIFDFHPNLCMYFSKLFFQILFSIFLLFNYIWYYVLFKIHVIVLEGLNVYSPSIEVIELPEGWICVPQIQPSFTLSAFWFCNLLAIIGCKYDWIVFVVISRLWFRWW